MTRFQGVPHRPVEVTVMASGLEHVGFTTQQIALGESGHIGRTSSHAKDAVVPIAKGSIVFQSAAHTMPATLRAACVCSQRWKLDSDSGVDGNCWGRAWVNGGALP